MTEDEAVLAMVYGRRHTTAYLPSGTRLRTEAQREALREELRARGGEEIPIRVCSSSEVAQVTASRLRTALGDDFVVGREATEPCVVVARLRRPDEPPHSSPRAATFDPDRWMTTEQAATALGVGRHWLYVLRKRGSLRFRMHSGRVLYRRDDVERRAVRYPPGATATPAKGR